MTNSWPKQRTMEKLAAFLEQWSGSSAAFCDYTESHDRFSIALRRRDGSGDCTAIHFTNCLYICGPTRWTDCELKVKAIEVEEGVIGFEVADVRGGFVTRCGGITVADPTLSVPRS